MMPLRSDPPRHPYLTAPLRGPKDRVGSRGFFCSPFQFATMQASPDGTYGSLLLGATGGDQPHLDRPLGLGSVSVPGESPGPAAFGRRGGTLTEKEPK